jgi:hypothetical protein
VRRIGDPAGNGARNSRLIYSNRSIYLITAAHYAQSDCRRGHIEGIRWLRDFAARLGDLPWDQPGVDSGLRLLTYRLPESGAI